MLFNETIQLIIFNNKLNTTDFFVKLDLIFSEFSVIMGANIGVVLNCLFDYHLLAQNWVKFYFSF